MHMQIENLKYAYTNKKRICKYKNAYANKKKHMHILNASAFLSAYGYFTAHAGYAMSQPYS